MDHTGRQYQLRPAAASLQHHQHQHQHQHQQLQALYRSGAQQVSQPYPQQLYLPSSERVLGTYISPVKDPAVYIAQQDLYDPPRDSQQPGYSYQNLAGQQNSFSDSYDGDMGSHGGYAPVGLIAQVDRDGKQTVTSSQTGHHGYSSAALEAQESSAPLTG
jgi:hypothetical protein